MPRPTVDNAPCEALFASALQRSDALTADSIAVAINGALRQFGIDGCASRMAQEFGDHPEAASERMRWAKQLVGGLSACSSPYARRVLEAPPNQITAHLSLWP